MSAALPRNDWFRTLITPNEATYNARLYIQSDVDDGGHIAASGVRFQSFVFFEYIINLNDVYFYSLSHPSMDTPSFPSRDSPSLGQVHTSALSQSISGGTSSITTSRRERLLELMRIDR